MPQQSKPPLLMGLAIAGVEDALGTTEDRREGLAVATEMGNPELDGMLSNLQLCIAQTTANAAIRSQCDVLLHGTLQAIEALGSLNTKKEGLAASPDVPGRHRTYIKIDVVNKKVEDVMPIVTGHEREEIKAKLECRKRSDMDALCGLFGTKISSLNILRVVSEQEGVPIEELNAGKLCDWFLKDKIKREQNIESAVLQWDESGFQI